ncbi:alanine racemase [Synechococcus sp. ROS8604]|uniref:alanine racemase n=1 Tax=Synechococcus sp. ROS8604 TaxID=1442557 RepID=UPI0016448AEB|nr:alanine racemase [Synechococcus sp. ROS8604]QNI87275.1 alanine racemase [Synechococcus sp. ROS8604]
MRDQIADNQNSPWVQDPTETNPRQRAWLEVSDSAIEANARALKRHLGPSCDLMAVVKADGYGHGAETVAKASVRGGATSFGVATLQEGIDLRNAGLDQPVLVLGHLSQPDDLRACLQWRLMPTLSSMREALLCQNLADRSGRRFPVQLKLDTGMTRLGCDWKEGNRLAHAIQQLDQLHLCGIYSHLALADGERDGQAAQVTTLQEERFESITRELRSPTLKRHLANSAGTLRDSRLHHDLVRVGLALYGHCPSEHLDGILNLEPALSVKAKVSLIREVPAGVGVSYGHRFVTQRPSRLAVVSIGYADGVSRCLSGRIHALHAGHSLPQVGAITMDQLILDATDHQGLDSGDVVTLLGRDEEQTISPRSWAELADSIPWEVLCSFKHRLPRLAI